MAVTASTSDPAGLLAAVRDAVATGKIQSWAYVQEQYLTHSVPQWSRRAFFKPTVQLGALVFHIIPPQNTKISTEVYAVYHGRLIEMLLAHFDRQFIQAFASALPISGDSTG